MDLFSTEAFEPVGNKGGWWGSDNAHLSLEVQQILGMDGHGSIAGGTSLIRHNDGAEARALDFDEIADLVETATFDSPWSMEP